MASWTLLIHFIASGCPSLGHRNFVDLRGHAELGDTAVLGASTNLTDPGAIALTPWKDLLHNGKLLGEGSFGRATLYELEKPCGGSVVVKEILRGKTKLLADELNTLVALRGHPHVIQIYDYFPDEPGKWFHPVPLQIMSEPAYGGELDSAFFNQAGGWFGPTGRVFAYLSTSAQAKRRELKKKIVLMMMRDILAGLSYVHEKGYIHQDIKPANVWSADEDASCAEAMACRYLLGDFGLAVKPEEEGVIGGGKPVRYSRHISGTPAFMAPEQWKALVPAQRKGAMVTFESDVFAVGLSIAVIMAYPDDVLGVPSSERPTILRKKEYYPPELHKLLEEMMSKDWKQRPSASDAHARAKGILLAEYPEAPEPSASQEPSCVKKCRESRKKSGGSCDPDKL